MDNIIKTSLTEKTIYFLNYDTFPLLPPCTVKVSFEDATKFLGGPDRKPFALNRLRNEIMHNLNFDASKYNLSYYHYVDGENREFVFVFDLKERGE
jgi:hypothetical protein